jgi:hypothetical protein
MRRAILVMVAAPLAGLMVAIAVGIGIAIRWASEPDVDALHRGNEVMEATAAEYDWARAHGWKRPEDEPCRTYYLGVERGSHFGLTAHWFHDEVEITCPMGERWLKIYTYHIQEVQCGWPMRCLRRRAVIDFKTTPFGPYDQMGNRLASADDALDAASKGGLTCTWCRKLNASGASVVIPCEPIWPGLLANTAFYGGILWALWFAPGAVRRGLRNRRGACVRCGYDLRSNPAGSACPECGAAP